MKIIDKRKTSTDFDCVIIGSTFSFLDTENWGDAPCMRIPEVVVRDGEVLNAIDLSDGYLMNVGDKVPVILCDAELIIK